MKVDIISTGSDGNCVIIDHAIVIDAGVTKKKFLAYLKENNIDPEGLKTLWVTHRHGDHYKTPVVNWCISQNMLCYLPEEFATEEYFLPQSKPAEVQATIEGYIITAYPQKHHDIVNYALVIEKDEDRLLYCTDLDTLLPSDKGVGIMHLGMFDTILLEGNYDEQWLQEYISETVNTMDDSIDVRSLTPDELDAYVRQHYRMYPPEVSSDLFRAVQNRRHLSKQQARLYAQNHLKPNGQYYEIHRSSRFYEKPDSWSIVDW